MGESIGSNVFPHAELKIFMQADLGVRAERRQKELLEKNQLVPIPEIEENLAAPPIKWILKERKIH